MWLQNILICHYPNYKDGHIDAVGHVDGHEIDYDTFAEAHKLASSKHLSTFSHGALGQDHFSKDAFLSALKNIFSHETEEEVKEIEKEVEEVEEVEEEIVEEGVGEIGEEGGEDPASMFF